MNLTSNIQSPEIYVAAIVSYLLFFKNLFSSSAIERADFPIIHILLDFGFRFQAVPRPSMCLQKEVDISTVVKTKNDVETRRNPIDWRLDTPGGPDWLLTALRTTEDTPILAAIRKNNFQEDVFDRLLKVSILMLSI